MNKKEEERRARLMKMREQRLPGIKKAHDEKMQQKKTVKDVHKKTS